MATVDKQQKFIELRANNVSYDKISQQIGVSKPTLIKWAKEFETDIANLRTLNLEGLQEQYKIGKRHKLEMWSEQLQAVREELKQRGYKDISTDKLVDLLERYSGLLDNEQVPLVLVSEPSQVSGIRELTFTEQDKWQA